MSERRLGAVGRRFALATPHVEATAAGLAAFDAGGNAVDAALAAATTLAVVYPHNCGVGGDLFALVRDRMGLITAVNGSGAAPAAVDPQTIHRVHGEMPPFGPLTVTVPGAVAAWATLAERWSTLGFARALEPAVAAARDGTAVSRSLGAALARRGERLREDPGLASVFFPGGVPLAEGEALVQPALARTLAALASEGPSAFYDGDAGEAVADHLASLGSAMTIDDLAAHATELTEPLSAPYRDLRVSVAPPNSQAFILLEILRAIERLGIDRDPDAKDAGTLAEVFRLAAIDRDTRNADPRRADVHVDALLGDAHVGEIASRARTPDARREPSAAAPRGGDTIALVAADDAGLAVCLIESLSDGFGSRILEPATGILLHNRGADFSLDPNHPNALSGGKRPAHTLSPVLVERDDGLAAVCGTRGGGAQPQINAMSLIRAFDLGRSAADALASPRWLVGGMAVGTAERAVEAEADVSVTARASLERAGFAIRDLERHDEATGHAHLILATPDGAFDVGTDPRADGEVAVR